MLVGVEFFPTKLGYLIQPGEGALGNNIQYWVLLSYFKTHDSDTNSVITKFIDVKKMKDEGWTKFALAFKPQMSLSPKQGYHS